jgi:glycosyltransferase involved in cell wall biosynthesis
VPAYNEAQHLRRTLDAIHAAARDIAEPYEIVVANDASTDDTRSIALAAGTRVVDVHKRHIAATRNAGARAAQGDVLLFVDADTTVTAPLVRSALAALRAGAVGGGATVRFDGHFAWQFRVLIGATVLFSRVTRLAFGCFIFCTRDVFGKVGGFDETLYATEEIAFSRSLKRHGRFVILRQTVLTSGRKLRAHSAAEVWRAIGHAALQWFGHGKDRRGLDAWYGARRADPRLPNAAADGNADDIDLGTQPPTASHQKK